MSDSNIKYTNVLLTLYLILMAIMIVRWFYQDKQIAKDRKQWIDAIRRNAIDAEPHDA